MSLRKYLHQVRPREESYVNHVDRIQNLFENQSYNLHASVGQAGLVYELKVFDAMIAYQGNTKIFGLSAKDQPTAGFSAQGFGDIEAKFNRKDFNIEIKLDNKAQLGSGKVYIPLGKDAYASEKLKEKSEPDDLALILAAANDSGFRSDVNAYLKKLASLRPSKNPIEGVEFTDTELNIYKAYNDYTTDNSMNGVKAGIMTGQRIPHIAAAVLKKDGLQARVARMVEIDAKAISNFYNGKKVFYMQIGGSGLYHLNRDPLKLGTKPFKGNARIELRIKQDGDSGGSTSRNYTKAMRAAGGQEFVDKLLKVQDNLIDSGALSGDDLKNFIKARKKNPDLIQARTRPIMASGRLVGKLANTDLTLDSQEGLEKLFKKFGVR